MLAHQIGQSLRDTSSVGRVNHAPVEHFDLLAQESRVRGDAGQILNVLAGQLPLVLV
ncbi:hypothetical protein D3C76_1778790 [compost metagenome]